MFIFVGVSTTQNILRLQPTFLIPTWISTPSHRMYQAQSFEKREGEEGLNSY